jgi:hypothetical protein
MRILNTILILSWSILCKAQVQFNIPFDCRKSIELDRSEFSAFYKARLFNGLEVYRYLDAAEAMARMCPSDTLLALHLGYAKMFRSFLAKGQQVSRAKELYLSALSKKLMVADAIYEYVYQCLYAGHLTRVDSLMKATPWEMLTKEESTRMARCYLLIGFNMGINSEENNPMWEAMVPPGDTLLTKSEPLTLAQLSERLDHLYGSGQVIEANTILKEYSFMRKFAGDKEWTPLFEKVGHYVDKFGFKVNRYMKRASVNGFVGHEDDYWDDMVVYALSKKHNAPSVMSEYEEFPVWAQILIALELVAISAMSAWIGRSCLLSRKKHRKRKQELLEEQAQLSVEVIRRLNELEDASLRLEAIQKLNTRLEKG